MMMNYVNNLFSRRNFNFGGSSNDDEEIESRPRNVIYSMSERVFGQYLPLFLYLSIMIILITGAIVGTSLYGETAHAVISWPITPEVPMNIDVGDVVNTVISDNKPISTGPGTEPTVIENPMDMYKPQGISKVQILLFGLSICSVIACIFNVISLRIRRGHWGTGVSIAGTTVRGVNLRTPITTANSAMMNQLLARLVQTGRAGDATALRSRLRLAMMNRDFDGNDYEMLQQLDDHNPHQGATEGEIMRLPVHVLTQANLDCNQIEAPQCSICLGPYEVGDSVKTVLCLVGYEYYTRFVFVHHIMETIQIIPFFFFDML
jgi:hypothetical protein